MFVTTLLQPKLLSLKNRWLNTKKIGSQIGRDVVISLFSIIIVICIYRGTFSTLKYLQANIGVAYLHPTLPLGLILAVLGGMLLFSSAAATLGSLYLAQDLDLIIASPISPWRFFHGKFSEIVISSTWMTFIFGVPTIIAFGQSYHAPLAYYIAALLVLAPYLLIPSACAFILVTVFTRIVPANRTKEILLIIFSLGIFLAYFMAKLIFPETSSLKKVDDLLRIVSFLSLPRVTWLPSFWASHPLGQMLENTGENYIPHLVLLYSVMFVLMSLSYILFRLFHFYSYSQAKSTRHGLRLNSKLAQQRLSRLMPFMRQPYRAILAKDIKVFSRDMTQAVQLMLLLGICMIYLYNFRVLQAIDNLPEKARMWWQGLLTLCNIAMGAFVITAVSTRFVFPTVSFEGQSFWILQSAPISYRDVLRAKFWTWFVPVAIISSIILVSGAFAINADPHVILVNALISWVLCYGIVGLAVGMGALFANFNWEHTSQLAASFGSLIYMLSSTVLILLNVIPTGLLVFLRTLRHYSTQFSAFEWYTCIVLTTVLLVYINYTAANWAMKLGVNALLEREK